MKFAGSTAAAAFGAIIALSIAGGPAVAAGAFDGKWVIDVPPSKVTGSNPAPTCPALRLPVTIADGEVSGSLKRGTTLNTVKGGAGPDSAPVTGTIAPDGTVRAQWENYHATGRLSGNSGTITIDGACGPRTAKAVRVP
jgi:hypothetical protein